MTNDNLCINAIRVLSAEAIDKANSGHPGLPLGSAPLVYTLYNDFLKFNPKNPKFRDRDRFVLSAGHGSMLLYSTLHLFGYDVTMEDIKNFRQLGAKTAGHPEYNVCDGVEISTGPLGQGIANAVGMAIAETVLAEKFNKENFNIVDHYTYALCGDGCMQEGIEYEAASLAGTLKLGKLIVLYDKNNITIEGSTDLAFTENVGKRHEAQGWQVLYLEDGNDTAKLKKLIKKAKAEKEKPSLIICRTKIGYGSPLENSEKSHGSPLGTENTEKLKQNLGYNYPAFTLPEELKEKTAQALKKGKRAENKWKRLVKAYKKEYPELYKEYENYYNGKYDIKTELDGLTFEKPEATRSTGSTCLNAVAKVMPNLFGGSADLGPSNKTVLKGKEYYSSSCRSGNNVHFGIREHAMSAIANGIAVHGGLRPYVSTFFVFSDYMKNGIRMSAIMNAPVTYIFTHDSIGVGEDGPTHEPIEQLVALRSMPNIKVFRPADGNETVEAYKYAFGNKFPCAIILSRQNLPQVSTKNADISKGGYIIADSNKKTPDAIIIATGSEVGLALNAKAELLNSGVDVRVVSMPCVELFEAQKDAYKQKVLPSNVKARIAVEAGSSYSWYKFVGLDGKVVGMDKFGLSAPAEKLFEHFGFTTENVVKTVLETL